VGRLKVERADYAGYCYGVERALKMASTAVKSHEKPIYTLGPIIHNPQVVELFKKSGVNPIDDIKDVKKGTVIIRTHGIDPKVTDKAIDRGLRIVDATCPFVAKAQNCAEELMRGGYEVIVIGERDHPEVVGILAHTDGLARVVEEVSDIAEIDSAKKLGVVVQTTQSLTKLREIIAELASLAGEIKIYNTICNATTQRQEAARDLATKADIMIVVGGKNSANTSRLASICEEAGTKTHHIETADEIDETWFEGYECVGVTAGASTPEWLLDEVVDNISKIDKGTDN